MQPSTSRHNLPRAGMVASPHSLEVAEAMGLDLFPKYNSLESLIYLAYDVIENQRLRHEVRLGRNAADEIIGKLDVLLQTYDMFAVASVDTAKQVYEQLDKETNETCPLFQFVVAATQQFYMHIASAAQASVIEDILSFGIGAVYSDNSVFDDEAMEGLPQADDVKEVIAANRWLVTLILYSLRPIQGAELVPTGKG